jgi:hypothetical protein
VDEIVAKLHVPKDVAEAAYSSRMAPDDPRAAEAKELLADKVDDAELHRSAEHTGPHLSFVGNTVFDLLNEMDKDHSLHKETVAELRKEFSSRTKRMHFAIDTYMALELEHDAFGVEAKVKAGIRGGAPKGQ